MNQSLTKLEVFVFTSVYFNLRCSITDRCQIKLFSNSVHIEFPSALKQKTFIHGEFSIPTKLGLRCDQHQKRHSRLLLGNQKVDPRSTLP